MLGPRGGLRFSTVLTDSGREIRRPNSETRRKSEIRRPKRRLAQQGISQGGEQTLEDCGTAVCAAPVSESGFGVSGFGFLVSACPT